MKSSKPGFNRLSKPRSNKRLFVVEAMIEGPVLLKCLLEATDRTQAKAEAVRLAVRRLPGVLKVKVRLVSIDDVLTVRKIVAPLRRSKR